MAQEYLYLQCVTVINPLKRNMASQGVHLKNSSNTKKSLAKGFSITIQTKSALVLRDIDLISQFKDIEVGITITTLDSKYARLFEPLASSPSERLRTLETLNKRGIKTYAFIGPLLPSISDSADKIHRNLNGSRRSRHKKCKS